MAAVFCWWLAISLLGLLALPLAFWILGQLPGGGLLFSRPLGLLFTAYVLWIATSLGVLRNNSTGIFVSLFLLACLSIWLIRRREGSAADLWKTLRRERGRLLVSELLFALGFVGWAVVRAYSADMIQPSGGEKFMEMAFLNSVLKSSTFPPLDPWLSGAPISYYYFGYVQMGLLTHLTGLQAGVAFQLHDAMLFGLALQLPYALAGEMAVLSGLKRFQRELAGLSAALFTTGMGNLEGLFESLYARGWLPASFSAWLALPDFPPPGEPVGSFYPGHTSWWWWRASRVINDLDFSGLRIPANPITEFPFFSFLLGDNHPHVLALPFALLAAALALDWARRGSLRGAAWRESFPRLALSAFVVGALIFLNTWDFPIYFALVLLAFAGGQYARQGNLLRADWVEMLYRALCLAIGSILLYSPFLLKFSSQVGGILPYIFPPTRLEQYLIMFGVFIVILAFFFPTALARINSGSTQHFSLRRVGLWWLRLSAGLALLFFTAIALAGFVMVLDQFHGGLVLQTMQSWLGGGSIGEKILRIIAARLANPWLFLLLSFLLVLAAALIAVSPRQPRTPPAQLPDLGLLFAALLTLVALAMTLSVEFFYLRDGFGVRMNTVFKFYFQAWLLLACACGFATGWVTQYAPSAVRVPFFLTAGTLVLACLVYPLMSIPARTHGFTTTPSLDGTADLRAANPDDWAAIEWLETQVHSDGQIPVLLEAPCQAYCYEGRISTFTGFPTVLGWSSHETQWRGNSNEQSLRQADIAAVFTTADPQKTLDILTSWHVDYVILGKSERDYITKLCSQSERPCSLQLTINHLEKSLIPVFRRGDMIIFSVPKM